MNAKQWYQRRVAITAGDSCGVFPLASLEMSQCNGHQYLLVLPIVLALLVGSFTIVHFSAAVPKETGKNAVSGRVRRDVSNKSKNITDLFATQGGIIYTRWGRTECPEGVEAVYKGIVGGSYYNNHGGGSNPLCLPMEPLWGTYNEAVAKLSTLYGAEYELPSGFNTKNAAGGQLQDHNVPCVVCHAHRKSLTIMIPARNLCYDDWTMEYTGYLMSENSGNPGRTQFICVDGEPEADPAGFRNENGMLFYNVEGVCGSLPCPPYIQRREITCVVCSK